MNFREVYKDYYSRIFRYLTRLGVGREEAEDLTQEVFIKVSEALPAFEGRSSLSTWIYTIATNTANDHFRSVLYQKGLKQTLPADYLTEAIDDRNVWTGEKEISSDKLLEKTEMSCCIRKYVETINENYKPAFILSEYEGLKNRDIAEILGISLETVKIRISRARSQLKKKMEKGCEISRSEGGLECNEI